MLPFVAVEVIISLVSRFPLFLPSVCVHNNTCEWKTGKKWGRPGSIHHVSGCEVDVGGEGAVVSIMIRSGVQTWDRVLERMIQSIVWQLGPSPFVST